MSSYLGIDTSNYTTSAAIYRNGEIYSEKSLLCVPKGMKGLRQSDALFLHIKSLPNIIQKLKKPTDISAVGVSIYPRDVEGSYMPCFLAGESFARSYSYLNEIPFYGFSHQRGHIAAVILNSGRIDLFSQDYYALHISGGTTEILKITPNIKSPADFDIGIIGETSDLSAGQIIDRVGVKMGLDFPCGSQMTDMADFVGVKPFNCYKNGRLNFSGLENKADRLNYSKEKTAAFVLSSVMLSLENYIDDVIPKESTILFSGGVMSNKYIKNRFTEKYKSVFAYPSFSTDNAAGISFLTKIKDEGI